MARVCHDISEIEETGLSFMMALEGNIVPEHDAAESLPSIRALTQADLSCLLRLSREAGWNQTAADWQRLLQLAPESCFGVEVAGEVVSSITAMVYGRTLAWIGMVLTLPTQRGQGHARSLLAYTLDRLDNQGLPCVQLDATDMGRPLYAQHGFREEMLVSRWERTPNSVDAPTLPNAKAPWHDAFGADRSALLASLASESAQVPDGFAMARPGSNAAYFGPCVAEQASSAEQLLRWCLHRYAQHPVIWDLPSSHTAAVQLAQSYGFQCQRQLWRMTRGGPAPVLSPHLWALAGFEFG